MSAEERMATAGEPYDRLAKFYDYTIGDFDADLDMYEAFARRSDAPVLELGVGPGRVALALAGRGLRVTGIDRSAAMLEIARRRVDSDGIAGIELHHQDFRKLNVPGSFGLIICALDTFLHLSNTAEQLDALRGARERLATDGLIAIDLPGPAGDWGDWDSGARPLVLDWSRLIDGVRLTRFSSFRADLAQQQRSLTDVFEETEADGTVRRHVVEYALRFVFPAEMELLLRVAGLARYACYGDYDLSPFNAASERMIVLAERSR
jgi:SAM-dependent methyltransferase